MFTPFNVNVEKFRMSSLVAWFMLEGSVDYKPIYRPVERDGFCRSCDKTLKRNKDRAVIWYSFRNRGMHVILCKPCVEKLYNLVNPQIV